MTNASNCIRARTRPARGGDATARNLARKRRTALSAAHGADRGRFWLGHCTVGTGVSRPPRKPSALTLIGSNVPEVHSSVVR